jgi:Na+-transporting methylmalonyl-CoA/oxaloacetate decarboxylase gamma subunit
VDNPLVTSLSITAIGMTLLFLALILFYGLMSLMMSVMQGRSTAAESAEAEAEDGGDEAVLQAAAIAVALARAETAQPGELGGISVEVEGTTAPAASTWWTLHHQRQLGPFSSARRRP